MKDKIILNPFPFSQGTMNKWIKERDEVVKTYDVAAFKEFYHKWQRKGLYRMPLPPDNVIEISLRKMVFSMKSATDEEKREAQRWLIEHGSNTDMEV